MENQERTMDELYERSGRDSHSIEWISRGNNKKECIQKEIIAINQLRQGEKLVAKELMQEGDNNTQPFNNYMVDLKDEGLDLGRGSCEFGYSMPPLERHERKKLILFKRR